MTITLLCFAVVLVCGFIAGIMLALWAMRATVVIQTKKIADGYVIHCGIKRE